MMPLSLPIMRAPIWPMQWLRARRRRKEAQRGPWATSPSKQDRTRVDQRRRQQPWAAKSARYLEYDAAAMMGMAHRDRERVGRIFRLRIGLRQQHADHHADLRLLAVAGADDGLFHQIRGVFGDRQARDRRHQHGDAARLAELARRGGVRVV